MSSEKLEPHKCFISGKACPTKKPEFLYSLNGLGDIPTKNDKKFYCLPCFERIHGVKFYDKYKEADSPAVEELEDEIVDSVSEESPESEDLESEEDSDDSFEQETLEMEGI